jgi:rhodanese-related sulfurtransferase
MEISKLDCIILVLPQPCTKISLALFSQTSSYLFQLLFRVDRNQESGELKAKAIINKYRPIILYCRGKICSTEVCLSLDQRNSNK